MIRIATTLALVAVMAVGSRVHAARTPHTHLLFSNVTNAGRSAGPETLFVIANTSMDPLGTATEHGTCTLTFFGTNITNSTYTTPDIAAGSIFRLLLSSIEPGFQGYAFADCNFNYAHAVVFVTDSSGHSGAYEALVLPAKKKRPTASEGLVH